MDFIKSQQYIAKNRAETIAVLRRFMQTDVILFWSDDKDLFVLQQQCWQPLLNDLNSVFKLNLRTTENLTPPENDKAEQIFAEHLQSMSDKVLTICFLAALELKSPLLGLLFAAGKINASEALKNSFLEEIYQNKFWGEDVAALNARTKSQNVLKELEKWR